MLVHCLLHKYSYVISMLVYSLLYSKSNVISTLVHGARIISKNSWVQSVQYACHSLSIRVYNSLYKYVIKYVLTDF